MDAKNPNPEMIEDRRVSVGDRRASIVDASNESMDLTVWETVKRNPKVLMASVAMTIGPLIYGFDNIIVGLVTAMPAFQSAPTKTK